MEVLTQTDLELPVHDSEALNPRRAEVSAIDEVREQCAVLLRQCCGKVRRCGCGCQMSRYVKMNCSKVFYNSILSNLSQHVPVQVKEPESTWQKLGTHQA